MKALVTGVPGFVGNYLARLLLEEGLEVWGTSLDGMEKMDDDISDKVNLISCDIREINQVKNILEVCNPDYIFHLAAQSNVAASWNDPANTFAVNVMGTVNLLDAVAALGTRSRTLMIGSGEEYGKVPVEQMPITETTPLNPVTPYGASKAAVGLLFRQYLVRHGVPVMIARAFNHIGAGQAPGFVAPDFARQIAEIEHGLREPMIEVGNLEAERDFTSVKDIVRAYWILIQKGIPGEAYNVASGQVYKIQRILDIMLGKSTKEISVVRDQKRMRPADVPVVNVSISKIQTATGWKPIENIEDTLEEVLDYWRAYIWGGRNE